MDSFIEKLERISPLMEKPNFTDTVERAKWYWDILKEYHLYENISILGTGDVVAVIVPSFHNSKFTQLKLTRTGDCACVSYAPTVDGVKLDIYIDANNKVRALVGTNNDDDRPVLDVFYAKNFVRFFHVVIPNDELSEVLFQFSTVNKTDLSFLEDFT